MMKEQLRIIADAMKMVANILRTALWESQRALDTLVLDAVCGDDLEDTTVKQ